MRVQAYKIALLAAALAAPAQMAKAQEAGDRDTIRILPRFDRDDVAGMRSEGGFTARPLRVGGFTVDASLATIAAYESNVFRRSNGEDDASLTLSPYVRAGTNANGFRLNLEALGVFRRFASLTTENSEEFDLGATVRSDLAQGISLYADAGFERAIEARSSVGSTGGTDEPVSFDRLEAEIGSRVALGSLRISPSVFYRKTTFSDVDLVGGGERDLGFRDTETMGGALRLGYEISPLVTVFARGSYEDEESTDADPGQERDSEYITVRAGIEGELSPLVIAQLSAGYRKRDYKLARFRDSDGLTFDANVQWFPTSLLSFRLQASQRFLNGGRADTPGILSSRISASAFYDPLRNLRIGSTITYARNDFRDVDTVANRASARVQAQYFLNPNIALGGYVTVRRQDVSGTQLVLPSTAVITGIGVILTP